MNGHDETFASAARALLARPLLDREDPAWPDVAARRSKLTDFFDRNCGWDLQVDNRAGIARLKKRTVPDPTRPLWRGAGGKADGPMRPAGYGVLMLAAADLMTRPVTTMKDLAKNLETASQMDPTLPPATRRWAPSSTTPTPGSVS